MLKTTVTCHNLKSNEHKITAIKYIRTLSGLGLKDAKDLVESGETISFEITTRDEGDGVWRYSHNQALDELGKVYGNVVIKTNVMEDKLTKLLNVCVENRKFELARKVLDVMESLPE